MSRADSATVMEHRKQQAADRQPPKRAAAPPAGGGRGPFTQYKPEQGRVIRMGTFIGVGALLIWGTKFLYDRLSVFEGDEAWHLLITTGIPIAFLAAMGAFTWWVVFSSRGAGDFMIATEGEMKKVSWSSRREVIGSTKVVIMFTILLAALLFTVDLLFQTVFRWIGVLKV